MGEQNKTAEKWPTDAMVAAYLQAQRASIEAIDYFPNVGGVHTSAVHEACRAGLLAALAAAPKAEPAQQATKGEQS